MAEEVCVKEKITFLYITAVIIFGGGQLGSPGKNAEGPQKSVRGEGLPRLSLLHYNSQPSHAAHSPPQTAFHKVIILQSKRLWIF